MRKLIIFCVVLLTASLTYSQVVTNGLIGYWGLDGNADDTAGINNWHGTTTGGVYSTDRFNTVDAAYDFGSGTTGDILIPAVQRTTKSMSISMWIYPTEIEQSPLPGHWAINQRSSTGPNQFQIMYLNTGTWFGICYGTTANDWVFIQSTGLTVNQWNHVVMQTEGTAGSTIEMYVNNVAQATATLPSDINYNVAEQIRIGQQGWVGTGGQLHGKVDEIALFNRVLTAAEVDLIYNYDPNSGGGGNGNCLWTDNGTNIYRIGKVAVNTETLPSGYDFAVDGKTVTKEVKVTLTGWADYVFEKDYYLPTLDEVEKYIIKKGHLQNIPSAKEVEEEGGFSLGEMNKKLLEKVEELTLYLIDQNKQLKMQEQRIKALEAELANQKK